MWSNDAIQQYERQGFLATPGVFGDSEINALRAEVDWLESRDAAGRVIEKDGSTVRALHGCHLESALMARLTRLSRIVEIATTLLASDVYVYQFKVNMKAALTGDVWPWHQDYIYWRQEDGMPACRAINIAVHLDDVHNFNGPLMVIPGSHRHGVFGDVEGTGHGSWVEDVRADLKYTLGAPELKRLATDGGIEVVTGGAGMIVAFHPNIAHASLPNLSPFGRRLLIVTYNSTENVPTRVTRPDFLVSRDSSPIRNLETDLLSDSAV